MDGFAQGPEEVASPTFYTATTSGLEADPRRCLAEWRSNGRIDPSQGADDSSDPLPISGKLYEREPEVSALVAAFDHERQMI